MIAPGSATRDRMMPSAGAVSVASASEVSAVARSAWAAARLARPAAMSSARLPSSSRSSAWRAESSLALLQLHLDQPAGDAEAKLGLADVDIAVQGQRVALPLAPAQPAGQVEPPAGGDGGRDQDEDGDGDPGLHGRFSTARPRR
jgi:hypothetical protein